VRCSDIIGTVGNTPLVEIARFGPNPRLRLFAKLEGQNPTGSVKDRIAKSMIEAAERSGELRPGQTILEPTSGNTGIGLEMMGRRLGYPVKVVMPDSGGLERGQLLELYGAEIVLTPGARGTNGAIEVARELVQGGEYYMPYQFGNPSNPLAHYEGTGAEILEDLPEVDAFVCGLGTGGTMMGVGKRLREHNPDVRLIGITPRLGQQIAGLRCLAEGFVPEVLDVSLLDRIIEVEADEACARARQLAQLEGIFAGMSSGAALHAALGLIGEMESGNIVVLLPDGGWKYLSRGLWAGHPERRTEDNKSL
jgi:cysteine synthase